MISIVANFYKSESFIKKLVGSVLAQSFADWELICVNDCSPGRDSALLHDWARRDRRIRVIDNPVNLGIARSKKVGIDAARGQYITFIDGDDFLAPDALRQLHRAASAYGVDVVAMHTCRYVPVISRKIECHHHLSADFYERRVENPELFDECFVNFFGYHKFSVTYWGKLYRADVLKSLDFDYPDARHTAGEDYKFSLCLFQRINSMAFISYMGYYWRWGGITSGKSNHDWAPYRFVMTHLDFYLERKALLDFYGYDKGYRHLLIELKNVIIAGVCNMLDAKCPAEELTAKVSEMLAHSSVDDVPGLLADDAYSHNAMIQAIATRDADTLVGLCAEANRHTRLRRLGKRSLLRFLSLFIKN